MAAAGKPYAARRVGIRHSWAYAINANLVFK